MSANLFPAKKMTPQQVGLLSAAVPSPFGDALGLLADAAGYAQDPKSLTPMSGLLSLAGMIPGVPNRRFYHGTSDVFKKFSDFQPNFFTESKEFAEGFAGKYGKKGRVVEAALDIKNPFDTRNPDALRIYNEEFLPFAKAEFGDEARYAALKAGEAAPFTTAEALWAFLRRKARTEGLGYDGLVVNEGKAFGDSVVPLYGRQVAIK